MLSLLNHWIILLIWNHSNLSSRITPKLLALHFSIQFNLQRSHSQIIWPTQLSALIPPGDLLTIQRRWPIGIQPFLWILRIIRQFCSLVLDPIEVSTKHLFWRDRITWIEWIHSPRSSVGDSISLKSSIAIRIRSSITTPYFLSGLIPH